jgi:hypothetical protein
LHEKSLGADALFQIRRKDDLCIYIKSKRFYRENGCLIKLYSSIPSHKTHQFFQTDLKTFLDTKEQKSKIKLFCSRTLPVYIH